MANYHAYDKAGIRPTDKGPITFDNLKDDMDKLRAKGAALKIVDPAEKTIGGKTAEGRDIHALKIGRDPSKRVLLVGCHHAREWISVEIPFLVGKYLIENYKEKVACKTDKEKRINYLVDNAEIWVVPLLNPDGHEETLAPDPVTKAAITGGTAWRANRNKVTYKVDTPIERWVEKAPFKTLKTVTNEYKFYKLAPVGTGKKETVMIKAKTYIGVDPNRNYPVPPGLKGSVSPPWGTETGEYLEEYDLKGVLTDKGWNLTTSKHPDPPTTYCGPSAGSENEIKAVVGLISKGDFKCIISYHNFSQLLLFPDDAAKDVKVQFLGDGMDKLFKDQIKDPKHQYKFMSGSGLYPTSGDTMEWAYRVHSSMPNYTIELPPTEADATAKDWAFNRFPATEIEPTFKHNLPVALCAINCAISGFAPGPMKAAPKGPKVKAVLNCWEVFLKASGWTP